MTCSSCKIIKCPKCKDINLTAKKLEDGLPVQGCDGCGGSVMSLVYYRDWLDSSLNCDLDDLGAEAKPEEMTDTQTALICAKCAKLMTKYKISGQTKNCLDHCSSCDEVWLDGGEWELLKALKLSKEIPAVFTMAWQRKIRKEMSKKLVKERFTQIFGKADMSKVDDLRAWIKGHPNKTEILFYLGRE